MQFSGNVSPRFSGLYVLDIPRGKTNAFDELIRPIPGALWLTSPLREEVDELMIERDGGSHSRTYVIEYQNYRLGLSAEEAKEIYELATVDNPPKGKPSKAQWETAVDTWLAQNQQSIEDLPKIQIAEDSLIAIA